MCAGSLPQLHGSGVVRARMLGRVHICTQQLETIVLEHWDGLPFAA